MCWTQRVQPFIGVEGVWTPCPRWTLAGRKGGGIWEGFQWSRCGRQGCDFQGLGRLGSRGLAGWKDAGATCCSFVASLLRYQMPISLQSTFKTSCFHMFSSLLTLKSSLIPNSIYSIYIYINCVLMVGFYDRAFSTFLDVFSLYSSPCLKFCGIGIGLKLFHSFG